MIQGKNKKTDKQEAIRKMLSFINLIEIHSKNKVLSGITLEFKHMKMKNKGLASLDMNGNTLFASKDLPLEEVVEGVKAFFERIALVEIDEQRRMMLEREKEKEEETEQESTVHGTS